MRTIIGMGIAAGLVAIASPALGDEAASQDTAQAPTAGSDATMGAREEGAMDDRGTAVRDRDMAESSPAAQAEQAMSRATPGAADELGSGGTEPTAMSREDRVQEANHEQWLHEIWYGP